MKVPLHLASLGGVLTVEACADRWRVAPMQAGFRLPHPADWPREWLDSAAAWRLSLQLGHLIDTGVAVASPDEISIPWSGFGHLDRAGFSIPLLWSEWSPFRLSIQVKQANWKIRFFLGGLEAGVERVGRFVRRVAHNETFLLDDGSFELLELVDRGPRSGERKWVDLGFLSAYAFEMCASQSGWLSDNDVVFPAAILSGPREGCLRRTSDTFISEVDRRAFRDAVGARLPGTQRLMLLAPGGVWRHIVLDDSQMLNLDRPSVDWNAPAEVVPHTGRIGMREAEFFGCKETLPVRLCPAAPSVSWYPQLAKRDHAAPTITHRHIESLAAADFAVRGYETIVLPRGCWTGASIIALSDRDVFLVRIEAGECDEEALGAAVRMAVDHQRICPLPYQMAIATIKGCHPSIRRRAEAAGIQILDRRGMLDASLINTEHIDQHERRRCRSLREATELLESSFAGAA